jgi:hypothetical protein
MSCHQLGQTGIFKASARRPLSGVAGKNQASPDQALGCFAVDQQGLGLPLSSMVDSSTTTLATFERGQVEHGVDQRLLQDRAQAARAGLALQRLAGDGLQADGRTSSPRLPWRTASGTA